FVTLVAHLKNNIILVQLGDYDPAAPPQNLSSALLQFLAASSNIGTNNVPAYWSTLKSIIWRGGFDDLDGSLSIFSQHGRKYGIVYSPLYPPSHLCKTRGCPNYDQKLMETTQRAAVLYTLSHGPIATYSISLKCDSCKVNFYSTYSVNHQLPKKDQERVYYQGVLSIIHVGGHRFVEVDLARLWQSQCVLAWTSMANCACFYNVALSKGATPPQDFPFVFQLSGDHVWSAIVQLSLIKDLALEDTTLAVRHGGEHKDRFTDVIQAHNLRIHMFGQELRHHCSKCTILYGDNCDITPASKFSVVVTDGITVGRPCCGVHNCHKPLLNNCDCFCLQTLGLVNVCAVIGCQQPTILSTKTCDLPTHQAVEEAYTLRGQAFFQLQKRLQRSHIANP
ncbi:hypothetical protein BDN67DRAFT_868878, partial [Paxillus ammoniavirescens]